MQTKIDVRRAIIERGYKISAFAEKCGMTPVNLRENIIKGNPTVKKLSEICEVLNCDITDLFYPIDESDNTENINPSFNEEKERKKIIHKNTYNSLSIPLPSALIVAQKSVLA